MRQETVIVAYVPTPLRTLQEICDSLGVGEKTVKAWLRGGATIAREGAGRNARYSAELAQLQTWRIQRTAWQEADFEQAGHVGQTGHVGQHPGQAGRVQKRRTRGTDAAISASAASISLR